MSVSLAAANPPGMPWRDEIRAMTKLAWPLVLTNLAQTAMTVTDVAIIGRLGGDALAAGALGLNLYFAPMILGLGLVYATAPMMATELGRRRNSVRDVRRTVRQGFWLSVLAVIPIWVLLWNGEAVLLAMGQEPGLSRQAGIYLRWLQWALLPFYFYTVLRSFMSALERPLWALVVMFAAVVFNAFANRVFVFGRLGIVPEAASTWFLPRIEGIQQALEWVYSAEILTADAAYAGRLVRSVHEPDELLPAAYDLARSFVVGRSPAALGLAKQLLYRNSAVADPLEAHLSDSLAMYYTSIQDGKEGVAAFLEKRAPVFTARASDLPRIFPQR